MSYGQSLALLVLDAPRLDGAACKGKSELFDPVPNDHPERTSRERAARKICYRCPALAACAQWLASLDPAEKPCGIVAGHKVPLPPIRTTARDHWKSA